MIGSNSNNKVYFILSYLVTFVIKKQRVEKQITSF